MTEKLATTREVVSVCNVVRKYRGVLPMAVASGGTRRNVHIILKAIGLLDAFEAILTADEAIPAKPNPDIFLESARLMSCAPETCLVFEDGNQALPQLKQQEFPGSMFVPTTQLNFIPEEDVDIFFCPRVRASETNNFQVPYKIQKELTPPR